MRKTRMTAVYALAHFCVDFACACLMFRYARPSAAWGTAMLLYNFCAFALQMPLGLAADCLRRDRSFALSGCILVCLAPLLKTAPLALSVLAGVGNALFHVGGGVAVLHAYETRLGPLGVFVSPGALGIFLGTLCGKAGVSPVFVCGLMLIAVGLLVALGRGDRPPEANAETRSASIAALGCLVLVVVLRSYLGFCFTFPWKTGVWALLATCGVVLGKTAGGCLADRLGMQRASLLSLTAAALLFLASENPVCGCLAIFCFNMSMPVTLRAAADALPGLRGFGFGLLTFALFLGFLPTWLGWSGLSAGWFLALGAAASLALLLAGLRRQP